MAKEVQTAAQAMGMDTRVFSTGTADEINVAFATFERERPDALFVQPDPFFPTRRVQLANLASRHALPSSFSVREIVEAGGLMSYGGSVVDLHRSSRQLYRPDSQGREAGPPAGPAVNQVRANHQPQDCKSTRYHLPALVLARADEVIE